jgi:transcriptional regulator with XRE-family HTH domain
MDAKAFGELLRQYRTAAGFSQEHLAELAHLSAESIGALERGIRRAPYRETVALISKALRLDDIARAELEAAAQRGRARGTRGEDADRERPSTRNLPLQSTSFVGREQDIATVVALLNENRLVTITGSGGVGKTRAVIEVAARLPEDRWPNIRFVDLSQLTESTLVARGIGAAFLPGLAEPGSAEALAAALRSSNAALRSRQLRASRCGDCANRLGGLAVVPERRVPRDEPGATCGHRRGGVPPAVTRRAGAHSATCCPGASIR